MIRVLLASSPLVRPAWETSLRAIPALTFSGFVSLPDLSRWSTAGGELDADVLLVEAGGVPAPNWKQIAELPLTVVALLDPAGSPPSAPLLRAGVGGVLLLDATAQEIEAGICAIHAGLVVTPQGVMAELLARQPSAVDDLVEPLSEREQEVLDLLAEGLSNRLIAQALSISEHTVKTHVASIFAKLAVSSRTEAVSQSVRRGLVML